MNIQQIQQSSLLDILFDGRNKEYGAYQLRQQYNNRLSKSIGIMLTLCGVLISGYLLAGKLHHSKTVVPLDISDVILADAKTITPKKEVIIPHPKASVQVAPPPSIRDVTIRITPDNQVKPTDVIPPNDAIPDNVQISTVTAAGTGDVSVGTPTPGGNGTGLGPAEAPAAQQDDVDKVFTKVEIESSYIGGAAAWMRFLLKNFHVPEDAAAELSGKNVVMVQFIVDKEGNVSNVEAVNGPEQLRKEAVRVIKLSGKWTPAVQNGRHVNSYKRQPIVVQLEEQ